MSFFYVDGFNDEDLLNTSVSSVLVGWISVDRERHTIQLAAQKGFTSCTTIGAVCSNFIYIACLGAGVVYHV